MRTLSAGLLAAQRAASIKPSVRSALDSVIYGPDRIVYTKMVERPYGSVMYLHLRNDDLTRTGEYRGSTVGLRWGAKWTGPVTEWSPTQPFFVASARHISVDGELVLELICIDTWGYLSVQLTGSGGVELTGTITGILKPGDKVTGGTSGATGTITATGDGYVTVGHVSTTSNFTAEIVSSDRDAANYITVTAATNFGSPTPGFHGDTTILGIIQNLLGGICTVTLDSSDGIIDSASHKPFFDVPILTPLTTIVKKLLSLTNCGFRFEDDGELHIFDATSTPSPEDYIYELDGDHAFEGNTREVAAILPNRVICMSVDYGDTALEKFSGAANDTASQTRWAASIGNGIVTELMWERCTTTQQANDYAAARLAQIQREANKGEFNCPIMNVGQELYDYVKVINPIDSITSYGWVGMIERVWDSRVGGGEYSMVVGLGNLQWAEQLPPTIPFDPIPPNEPNLPVTDAPVNPWGLEIPEVDFTKLPKAVQGYHTALAFSSVDWNTVQWSSSSIKFYDGTTQAITGSNTGNIGDDAIRYIYFDLADANPNLLKVTTNYFNVFTQHTGLLCIVQRGALAVGVSPERPCSIIPSYGKEPLITADMIILTGLYDAAAANAGDHDKYAGVLSTNIQAGLIKLSAVYYESNYQTISAANRTYWNGKGESNIKTFAQTSAPTSGMTTGDLWIDTTGGANTLYRYSGSAWVKVQDSDIDAALTNAAIAQATADGKVVAFWDDNEPSSGMSIGDIWYDTNDGNKIYRYTAGGWVESQDDEIAQALQDASDAQATADGKVNTYYQDNQPTCNLAAHGDLWVDTDDDNKMWRCEGNGTPAWEAIGKYLADTEISAGKIHIWSGTVFDNVWYNKSGVKLIANVGIQIYGNDSALTLRKTEDGDIQVKMTSTGQLSAGGGTVILDENGIVIKGAKLTVKDSAGANSGNIYVDTNGYLVLDAWSRINADSIYPVTGSQTLGDGSNKWWGYFNHIDTKSLTITDFYIDASDGTYIQNPVVTSYPTAVHGMQLYRSDLDRIRGYVDSAWRNMTV